MGIKKYYTTRDGEKIHIGWLAQLIIDGKSVEHQIIHDIRGKSRAENWLKSKKKAIKDGIYAETQMTLVNILDLYLKRKESEGMPDASIWYWKRAYRNFMRIDEKWLNMPILDLNNNKVYALLENLKESIKRKRKHFSCELAFLSASLNFYKERYNYTFAYPITKMHRMEFGKAAGKRRSNKIKVALDFSQIPFLLKNLKEKGSDRYNFEIVYYYIVRLQLIYGLRIGEACGLEWRDIDFNKKTIRLTGTIEWVSDVGRAKRNSKAYRLKEEGEMGRGEAIDYPMTSEIESLLLELKSLNRSDRWVFANRDGNVPQYSKIRQRLISPGILPMKV